MSHPMLRWLLALMLKKNKAAPTVVSKIADNNGSSTGTSVTVNLPESIASGRRLVVAVYNRNGGTWIWPEGWTERTDSNGLSIAERPSDGSEGASITVTASTSGRVAYIGYQIAGSDLSSPIEVGTTATGSSTTPNPPSVTPSWGTDPTLVLAVGGSNSVSNLSSYPADYSDGQTSRASNDPSLSSAQKAVDPGASADPDVFTIGGSSSWAAQTVLIRGA